jgi:hypothetical protein
MTTLDLAAIHPGLTGTASLVVAPEHTAPRIGSGRIAVLATPVMINLIEAAALAAVEHLLPAGHQSLGIHLDVRHFAATPVGLRVTATAEVTASGAWLPSAPHGSSSDRHRERYGRAGRRRCLRAPLSTAAMPRRID